ncbi:MAG: TAT-variant-translocated molybdopterin oxidoreductase [Planctomycetes bacterium]|nr:TAT-variant-translocated molybdopterin oxidoreductase [Planctomycetota bacterium]
MIEEQPTSTLSAARDGGALPELAGKSGPEFWRSLEELSGTERFQDFLRREYPDQAEKLLSEPERRTVLKLMGASLGLAGLAACTKQPEERILPYAKNPESTTPGVPLYFATAMPWARGSIGLLVENHQGRPTKIEGNPDHPASKGATDAFAQAAVLELYDPDRSTAITKRGRTQTYDEFLTELRAELNVQGARQGAGLAIVLPTIVSPTLARQIRELRAAYPQARIVQWDAIHRDEARAGALAAFGKDVVPARAYDKARVVLALDDDFLGGGPEAVRAARDFAPTRRARKGRTDLSRLYVVESAPSVTGTMADHRLPLRAADVEDCARRLAQRLGLDVKTGEATSAKVDRWVDAVAKDLQANAGASIVTTGDWQPAAVHHLVAAINDKLGNVGKTVRYMPPVDCLPQERGQIEALRELAADMQAGKVEALVLLGVNPAYDAPADLDFAAALSKVPFKAHSGLHLDETGIVCEWHVPAAHFLESWGDARAADGTVTIVQPLILPLRGGKSAIELVNAMLGKGGESAYEAVRATWQAEKPEAFEANWRRWLHDGVVPGTAAATVATTLKAVRSEPRPAAAGIEVLFRPDPTIWDGRFANNGWLQELPKPATKITWDNTVQLAPALAARLGLATGDVVEVAVGGRSVRGPVWVSPGQADSSVTLHVGYGRKRAGHVGSAAGFDAFALRTSGAAWMVAGASIHKTGETFAIASTQEHVDYDIVQTEVKKRQILRVRTVDRFAADPHSLDVEDRHHHLGETDFYKKAVQREIATMGRPVGEHQWGMVIDLNACTACGACVTACQAENNIAVVGKDQVLRGREMHWIRIDRYFDGPVDNPRLLNQPVPCMHCENAPCEVVCPVGATQHSPEGLNEMAYNRCVGTRYCSNNCPYKVRRFNFMLYSDYVTETLKLQRNPDVTVRSRGVMEKCTYCVQRINHTRITAKREGRKIREGEIVTACQQACPTEAIVFGDVADQKSAVSRLREEPHEYGLIEEYNTKPRTTYLAKIRNPNPDLAGLESA